MCGIAGIVTGHAWPCERLQRQTAAMTAALAHRGPDHGATWTNADGRVALGYRRLAIIDLTPDGNQPIVGRGGTLRLVFNGEIYNYVEIRHELESSGVRFRGHSDTEVLLAAIEHWDLSGALERVAGMFAFALWDARDGVVRLVRDRAGKKPLYYADTGDGFFFASEIKALRDGAGLPLNVDREALHHYLSLGFVPGRRTAYREIREVGAGCWMEVWPDGRRRHQTYWTLPVPERTPVPAEHALHHLESLLEQAVAQRLRADVDVGIFLSGGVDSGLITACASRLSARPLKTFTVTFDDQRFDESAPAAAVAARYGTEHTVIHLTPDVEALLPRVAAAYDEPFGDPSAVPTFAVAAAASRELKVVLNGEGADELFGGYRRHLAIHRAGALADLAAHVPALGRAAAWLPAPRSFRTPYSFFARAARGISQAPLERYITWSSDGFSEAEKRELAPGAGMPDTASTLAADLSGLLGRGTTADFMALDFALSLGDCLLVKMDIATMAHSLEARSPFLDHRLVEAAARLPRQTLFDGPGTKPLLRRLAAASLPADVVTAPKRGFEIPVVDWLMGPLRGLTHDVCLSRGGLMADLFDRAAMETLLGGRSGVDRERWGKRVWTLLMLGLWDAECNRRARAGQATSTAGVP